MSIQKHQYATSRSIAAGRQILNHLSDRGHIALWLGNNQHQCESAQSRFTVFFPCTHAGMNGRLIRIFPKYPTRPDDTEMLKIALSFPWVHPGMQLVAFNALRVAPDGMFAGDVWARVRHALDQLCGYKVRNLTSRRRRRGGHNEHLFSRYALG